MAITSSAKKAIRSSEKKRIDNLRRSVALRTRTKAFLKAITLKDAATTTEKLLSSTYAAVDKAMKRGIIKPNTAARKKSRLASLANTKQ